MAPDGQTSCPFASDGLRDLYGIGPEDIRADASPVFTMIHPDDADRIHQANRISAETLQPWKCEFRIVRKDKSIRWVSGQARPERSAEGGTVWHGFISDVTDRRQTEAALQEHNRLSLASVCHDIRTPMNAMIGMTDLLARTELSPEQQDYVEVIKVAGNQSLSLINNVLDFSKLDAGKLVLERAAFNLRDCVESSLDLVAPLAAKKGIELLQQIDSSVPEWALGDVTRLRQIFVNLLNNGVKFTNRGEVEISLSCERRLDAPHLCNLKASVRDTGVGMTPDEQLRIFGAFEQTDASISRRFGGTGLGLAICSRLVQAMSGSLRLESVAGQGTIFYLEVRLEVPDVQPQAPVEPPAAGWRGRQILIADRYPANARHLAQQLSIWEIESLLVHPSEPVPMSQLHNQTIIAALIDYNLQHEQRERLMEAAKLAGIRKTIWMIGKGGPHPPAAAERQSMILRPVKRRNLARALYGIHQPPSPDPDSTTNHLRTKVQLATTHPLRILVVEDNPVNQEMLIHMLASFGYHAEVASNGNGAIAALDRQSFDLVLMDLQMPFMDGLQTSRLIHQRWPRERRPRIIAVTANALPGDRERCLAAGMDDYMSKPIRADLLRLALQKTVPLQDNHSHSQESQDTLLATFRELRRDVGSVGAEQILSSLLLHAPAQLDEMKRGLAERNRSAIRAAAHRLAGNFAIFNLHDLRGRCAELQKGAFDLPDAAISEMAEALFDGFSAIRPRLESLRAPEWTEKDPKRS